MTIKENLNEDTQHIKVWSYGETKESREDIIPRVQEPWRRFFARMLDESVYYTLWYCFLLFVFQIRTTEGIGWAVVNIIVILLLTIVLEPLQLSLFGTTFGKWVLGLHVSDSYDGKLSFSYAYDRTKEMLFYGLGLYIPVFKWYRMWKSFVKCTDGNELEWEYGSRLILKDRKKYRIAAYVAAHALLIGVVVLANVLVEIPVNRGELTIAEFCENYRYLEEVLEIDSRYTLDDNGIWQDEATENGTVVLNPFNVVGPPEFIFETNAEGNIEKISFVVEIESPEGTPKEEKQTITSYWMEMTLAALAYVGAQEEFSHFSSARVDIVERITACEFEDFDFTEAGIRVICDVESMGYIAVGSGALRSLDDGACSFYMEFSMSDQN